MCFQTDICFDLSLNADLIVFTHRRRAKEVLELGELLLEVATGLACNHVGFCLPQGNRDTLACLAVCQQVDAFVSLLLFGSRHHRIPIDADCLVDLAGQNLGNRYSCIHGLVSFLERRAIHAESHKGLKLSNVKAGQVLWFIVVPPFSTQCLRASHESFVRAPSRNFSIHHPLCLHTIGNLPEI